jgi:uncharacterized lipoprotein YehR (DUF1307 family)
VEIDGRGFMKKILLLAMVIVLIVSLTGCSGSKEEKIVFSNTKVELNKENNFTRVFGEVSNNDSKKHTFSFTVTFYDNDNKILGTASGAMLDLEANKTKTFDSYGNGIFDTNNYKIQIDTID